MSLKILRIATRQSPLALCQANLVKQQLQQHYPGLQITLVPMVTTGDKFLDKNLANVGGKGLFVKELEQALLNDHADLAIHSMKDVPNVFPPELELAVICARAEARDVLVATKFNALSELPHNAMIGTSSLRRQCQIKAIRPDLNVHPLRGNIGSRLKKLANGEYDAIILAAAGLQRLQLASHITQYLSIDQLLPAAGQGALGIECRKQDSNIKALIKILEDPLTTACIRAERSLTARLGGNCQVPIGAYCEITDDQELSLRAMVGAPDGDIIILGQLNGVLEQPEQLGEAVANSLLSQGADIILRSL